MAACFGDVVLPAGLDHEPGVPEPGPVWVPKPPPRRCEFRHGRRVRQVHQELDQRQHLPRSRDPRWWAKCLSCRPVLTRQGPKMARRDGGSRSRKMPRDRCRGLLSPFADLLDIVPFRSGECHACPRILLSLPALWRLVSVRVQRQKVQYNVPPTRQRKPPRSASTRRQKRVAVGKKKVTKPPGGSCPEGFEKLATFWLTPSRWCMPQTATRMDRPRNHRFEPGQSWSAPADCG